MKIIKLTILLLIQYISFGQSFGPGEVLEYRLHYGPIVAGFVKLEVNLLDKKIGNKEIYHIIGTGRSTRSFDLFFSVRDRYETFLPLGESLPILFIRDVNEGGYKIKQRYRFVNQVVINESGENFPVPIDTQDMLSAFYYARTIDFSSAKVGEIFTIWTFVDDEIWPLKIKFAGREIVKVNGITYKSMKFHPVIQTGRLFKNESDVTVWISDDLNKIPLLSEGKVIIGSIRMELTKYSGLLNPISKIN